MGRQHDVKMTSHGKGGTSAAPRRRAAVRTLFASLGLARVHDRVARRLPARPRVDVKTHENGDIDVDIAGTWRWLFGVVSFVVGCVVLLFGVTGGGNMTSVGVGLVLAGFGPAAILDFLHAPPDKPDDPA